MAEDKNSAQENKSYARLNILQALQNVRKDDYPLPVQAPATPTKPSSSNSNGEGEEEEPGKQQKLREVVKTLQMETRGPSAPPLPAAMQPRSPRHSPSSK